MDWKDADKSSLEYMPRICGRVAIKRKRCSTDFDLEHEPKKRNTIGIPSPSSVNLNYPTLQTVDQYRHVFQRNSTALEVYKFSGRPLEDDVDDDTSSPSSCHSSTSDVYNNSWHTRGDVTPHAKQPWRQASHHSLSPCPHTGVQCCIKPTAELRPCPIPALSWANASDVWKVMCQKDEIASLNRSANMLDNHPGLQARMRAILLDWLIEVCEVYKLHREAYYLAVDYLDRYLSSKQKIQKTHLQLIGITCLFVAAKVEEIYPPKIGEFAYVTDGACQEEDIIQQELLLLKALDWNISPVTVLGWLGVYMQLNVSNRTPASFVNRELKTNAQPSHVKKISPCKNKNPDCSSDSKSKIAGCDDVNKSCSSSYSRSINRNSCKRKLDESGSSNCSAEKLARKENGGSESKEQEEDEEENVNLDDSFIYPQFSGMEFVQTAKLLDLCSLDLSMASFPYSVIAAAAMSHTFTREIAVHVSGLEWDAIAPCADWMAPFFHVIRDESAHVFLLEQHEQVKSKFGLGHVCPNIVTDDSHILQTHTTSVDLFDKAIMRRDYIIAHSEQETSPATLSVCPEGLLTPPLSSRKPLDVDN